FEQWKNETGGYRYFLADIDIDNTGKKRPVLMFERVKWDPLTDANYANYYVLDEKHNLYQVYKDGNRGRIFFVNNTVYVYKDSDPGYVVMPTVDSHLKPINYVRVKQICEFSKKIIQE